VAEQPARNSVTRNLVYKTLGTVVEKALKLAMVPLIVRTLGPRVYGQYSWAVTVAALAVQMTDMGLGLFLAREIARHETPPAKLIGQMLTLKGVLAVGYLLVMAGLTWWHFVDPQAGKDALPRPHAGALAFTIAFVGLAALATSAVEAIWQVFRGVQRLELEARSSGLFAGMQFIAVFSAVTLAAFLWPNGSDLSLTMVAIGCAMSLASLAGAAHALWLMRRVVAPEYGWSRDAMGRFVGEILPLGVAIVASLVYFKVDVLMLRAMRGDEELGYYSVAYNQLQYAGIVPAILMAALFPALSQTVVKDPAKAWRLHQRTLFALFSIGLIGALILAGVPDLVIHLLYGKAYEPSILMLRVLAPSVILTLVNYLETHMLVALGLVSEQMAFTLVLVVVNVGANWYLVPRFGGVGAGVATALTELVLLGFCGPLVWREMHKRMQAVRPA
jgi:O-antigen/teichoic acid export membrane protein